MKLFIRKHIVYIYATLALIVFSIYQFFHLLSIYVENVGSAVQVTIPFNPWMFIAYIIMIIFIILLGYTVPLMIYIHFDVTLLIPHPVFHYLTGNTIYQIKEGIHTFFCANNIQVLRC